MHVFKNTIAFMYMAKQYHKLCIGNEVLCGIYMILLSTTTAKISAFFFFQRWILTLLTTQLPNHCFQQDLRVRFKKVSDRFGFVLTS